MWHVKHALFDYYFIPYLDVGGVEASRRTLGGGEGSNFSFGDQNRVPKDSRRTLGGGEGFNFSFGDKKSHSKRSGTNLGINSSHQHVSFVKQ